MLSYNQLRQVPVGYVNGAVMSGSGSARALVGTLGQTRVATIMMV